MKNKEAEIRAQIDKKLDGIQFTESMKAEVLKTAKSRKTSFWNREVTIPIPIAFFSISLFIILLCLPLIQSMGDNQQSTNSLIFIENSFFYEQDLLELFSENK